jgi:hypothetical protein
MVATPTTTTVEEIIRTMATLPPEAQKEVLDFALFLQTRITAEDAKWDAAFAATDPAKLRAWLDAEKAGDDDLRPMFDEAGEIAL